MTSKQKIKGNKFESEIVKLAEKHGYRAERARGSDGRALGLTQEVDCVIYDMPVFGNMAIQAKRRKVVADYLEPPAGCQAVVVRGDRGKAMIVIDFEWFLEVLDEQRIRILAEKG